MKSVNGVGDMNDLEIRRMYNEHLHEERLSMGRIASITALIIAPLFYLKDVYMTAYVMPTFFWRMVPVVAALLYLLMTFTRYRENRPLVKGAYLALTYSVLVMMLGVFYVNYGTAGGKFDGFLISGMITTLLLIQLFSSPIRGHMAGFSITVILFFLVIFIVKGGTKFFISNMVNPVLIIVMSAVLSYLAERKSFSEFRSMFLLELNDRALRDEVEYRKSLEGQLKDAALHDALTDVYNKRAAEAMLPEKVASYHEENRIFSLIYIDLDDLKVINDQKGHDEGDRYLMAFVKAAKEYLGESTDIFRIGGDEFIIIMDNLDDVQSEMMMIDIKAMALERGLQFSYGIATYMGQATLKVEELIKEADIRMYNQKKQKKQSKNQVLE